VQRSQLGWICAPLTIVVIHFYLKQQNKVRAAKLAALGGVQEHAKVQERDGEVVDTDHGMLDLVSHKPNQGRLPRFCG
jgi:hypothetical protein